MTDPKLVEKATDLFKRLDRIAPFPWIMIPIITKALQSHGEEVRRKTVEECAKVAFAYGNHDHSLCGTSEAMFEESISNGISTAILKLLEVK